MRIRRGPPDALDRDALESIRAGLAEGGRLVQADPTLPR